MWRIRHAAVCVLLTAFAFNSASGSLVPDTKLDLTVDPLRFLARALQLWDAQGSAGQVQDQAYGYLFPMGPFFALGEAAHLPMWAVQRLWWSALLCTAFLGVVALARRLAIGTPAARLVAGLAFALSPHVLTVLGPTSVEALPMCVAPWVIVPLVPAVHVGSIRRAATRSGVAVLFMGAVNAGVVLAAIVPAALWLITRRPDRRVLQLTGAWLIAVALATAWWIGPLLLFGRYTVPFLGHIEAAPTTTAPATLVETLRGTADWVAYLPNTAWHAGALLLTQSALVVNTVVVVAFGLAGLALRSMPARSWVVTSLVVGVLALTAGHVGDVQGVFAGHLNALLDGVLAPLRNVHKFDVVLRLPLALGLAHLVSRLRWGTTVAERHVSGVLVTAVAAGAVVGMATPLLALQIAPAGQFTGVPDYWKQVSSYLADQHATGRALLVPGSRFGQYLWGAPMDEPMQPLARTPWDVRGAVPLSDPGHVRMLDAVDARLATGMPSPGLAAYLARGGIQFLVVRNDLDPAVAQTPRNVLVHQALESTPGLFEVQAFGPPVGGDTVPGSDATLDQHLQLPYRAVEVWEVAGPAERRVEAEPTSSTVQVSGGPESLLPLSDAGLSPETATVLTGNATKPYRTDHVVLTDGLRRREIDNGASPLDTSATLALDDPLRMAGHPDRDYLPFPGSRHQSRALLVGARAVRASSSASDPDAFGGSVHADQPYSAFDGDPRTAWRSNPLSTGVGQWLEIDFGAPRQVDAATVRFTPDSTATAVQVRTDAGTAGTAVSGTRTTRLDLVAGTTRSLRLTVTSVSGPPGLFHEVGVSDLSIAGVSVQRTIVMPGDLSRGTPVQEVEMSTPDDARNACVFVDTRPLCVNGLARQGEESGVDRTFTLPAAGSYSLSLTAVPRAGAALDHLISSVFRPGITASASSRLIADPLAGPETTVDGDLGTGWISRTTDPAPTLELRWGRVRTFSSLVVLTDPFLAATAPDTVKIRSGGQTRVAAIAPNGVATFRPLTSRRISLTLSHSTGLRLSFDPYLFRWSRLPIGVSEVTVPGVLSTNRFRSDALAVELPCGTGPYVFVDGTVRSTMVSTTLGALRDLSSVPLQICGDPTLRLAAGRHRLRALATPTWTVKSVDLRSPAAAASALVATIPVAVRHWGSDTRTVSVGRRASPTLLVVHENANPGWAATLRGRPLPKITVDGWQQGYLLPSGAAGQVELRYVPDTAYRAALLGGAAAVLLLVLLAFIPGRRPRDNPPRHGVAPRAVTRPMQHRPRLWRDIWLAMLALAAALGLWAVLAVFVVGVLWLKRPRLSTATRAWLGVVPLASAALAVALLACGRLGVVVWAAVLLLALAADVRRDVAPFLRHAMAAVAGVSYLGAGLVLARHHWGEPTYAAGRGAVQALALSAVLATVLATVRAPRSVAPSTAAGARPSVSLPDVPAPVDAATSPDVPPPRN